MTNRKDEEFDEGLFGTVRTPLVASNPVISEAQKQARLGWSTVHMARHYTDVIEEEDRRAAEHIGCLLAGKESGEPQTGQVSAPGAA